MLYFNRMQINALNSFNKLTGQTFDQRHSNTIYGSHDRLYYSIRPKTVKFYLQLYYFNLLICHIIHLYSIQLFREQVSYLSELKYKRSQTYTQRQIQTNTHALSHTQPRIRSARERLYFV